MDVRSGPDAVTRRRALRAVGAGAVAGLAGCLGALGDDGGAAPEPVDLSGGTFDYEGGMEIGRHGGPNGQVFYAENEPQSPHATGESPQARDDLAWFHTLVHGLFPYHFARLDRGWEAAAIYVTDYSAVDWALTERDGERYMPAPTAAESFADATGLSYVVESDVLGGMGPDLFPFADSADAGAFADEHGGRTVGFEAIDRELVESLRATP